MERIRLLGAIMFSVFWISCGNTAKSELQLHEESKRYQAKIEQYELQREESYDTLFFGVHFKMSANQFFDHCNVMYDQDIFDGNYSNEILLELNTDLEKPIEMRFYPLFRGPIIDVVRAQFKYARSSVFNSQSEGSRALIEELQKLMMKWYGGNAFYRILPRYSFQLSEYVKVDGNRKITLKEDDSLKHVIAIFEDLNPL